MQIEIQSRRIPLNDGLREHVRRRIQFAVGRFADRIRHVTVQLSDINGPRGGVDKRCQLRMRVEGLPDIVVDDTEMNLYAAVSNAAGRAGRALSRYAQRARWAFAERPFARGRGNFA